MNRRPMMLSCIAAWMLLVTASCALANNDVQPHIRNVNASHVHDNIEALYDGIVGTSSNDHSIARFTWWNHRGTAEWIEYAFDQPARVDAVHVQWFDDTGRGECRVPQSWRLLYRDGDAWRPVSNASGYPTDPDQLHRVAFDAVTTSALRLEVQLQPQYSGGILAWHVPGINAPVPGPQPITIEEGLFDETSMPTMGLREAPGAETITVFAPRDDTDKFSNGVQVYPFKGYLYAQWQSTPIHEDTRDGRVVWSRSRDGVTWSTPQELASPPDDGRFLRSGAGFWSDGETLVAYNQRVDGWGPGKVKITEARTTKDGVNWTPIQTVTERGAMAENVKSLPDGKLLTMVHAHLPGSHKMFAVPAVSESRDGLVGWRIVDIPQPLSAHNAYGRGIESSWYTRADGKLVMIFRDMNRSGYVVACVGEPDGETWGDTHVTGMPDSNSMQCAGNLPDGTVYLVNNPTRNRGRIPLTVSLSRDGVHFDRAWLVRGDSQPRRYEGNHKSPGFSYPGAVVWNEHLYIAYATNKEDVEITRIPLQSLMLNGE